VARRGHGEATELLVEDIDLDSVDAVIASGGTEADLSRTTMLNTFLGPGRFGRMFPNLKPFRPPVQALIDLGEKMKEADPSDPALDNTDVPAGFTYLGQFIDHDVTFDRTPDLPDIVDPEQMKQERTPTLDLDSLYGRGPRMQPGLYDSSVPRDRAIFKIGSTVPVGDGSDPAFDVPTAFPNDLPRRRSDGKPIIADERNDENLAVAQTHLAFLKFHNEVMRSLPKPESSEDDDSLTFTQAEEDDSKRRPFHEARRLVRWHYQWLVLNDFLPRLVMRSVLNDVLENGRSFYDFDVPPFDGEPFMPIEFSVAAYRLGHSMVRETYNYNRVFPNAFMFQLFQFSSSGGIVPIPSNWIIDWRRFHEVGREDLRNPTRRLDTKLIPQLHDLPTASPNFSVPPDRSSSLKSLAVRNLLRGRRVGLPTAQAVAKKMKITPLTPDEIASGDDGETLRQHRFHERTPLWYYVLKEAEIQRQGRRLGQLGSRIVAEVFVGLLQGDPNSFLTKDPDWKPTVRASSPGTFTMVDLLRFVGEINPIG
jgi:hypothetical protein